MDIDQMPVQLIFKEENFQLDCLPQTIESLNNHIQRLLDEKLPNYYKIYVIDSEGDTIIISSDKELQTIREYFFKQFNNATPQIYVDGCDQSQSVYFIRQPNFQKIDSSEIFQQSVQDAKKKVQELQENMLLIEQQKMEQSLKLNQRKGSQLQEEDQSYQESIFRKPVQDLNSNKIMDYYKTTIANFEKNMLKQTPQHIYQNQQQYMKSYEGILRRMNEKLMQNFVHVFQNSTKKSEKLEKNEEHKVQQIQPQLEKIEKSENKCANEGEKQEQTVIKNPVDETINNKALTLAEVLGGKPFEYYQIIKDNPQWLQQDLINLIMDQRKDK